MADEQLRYVTTRTPLRVSFAGGGTDLPAFYQHDEQGGAVLSTAIDRYLYVTVKRHDPLFQEQFRLNYSVTEHVNRVEEIQNDIARECLRFLRVEPPLYIGVIADLPSSSGLGSSSSFAVGLLNAIHRFQGHCASANQLAEEAAQIEMTILGRPIGKQDHYAAAFGGMHFYRFLPNGRVSIEPSQPRCASLNRMFDHLMMFWTNRQRDAAAILTRMNERMQDNFKYLRELRDLATEIRDLVTGECRLDAIGDVLNRNWELKKRLAGCISNPEIDGWFERAIAAGARGGKLCGAGGGGFLLFLAEPKLQAAIREVLRDLTEVNIGFAAQGTTILHAL